MLENWFTREKEDMTSRHLWRAAAAEFIGTLLLTMFGVGASLYDVSKPETTPNSVHVALETGFYVGIIIAALGHVSGAHVNPAVSMGFLVCWEITCIRFIVYVTCQTLGAICGAGILWVTTPGELRGGAFGVISPGPGVTIGQALMCETVQGFLLLLGIRGLLDAGRTDVHGSAPLLIGIIVTVNVFFGWNISGGCMNPARNFGPAVITAQYQNIWLYWLGPMLGGALGAFLYRTCFSAKTSSGGCRSETQNNKNSKDKDGLDDNEIVEFGA